MRPERARNMAAKILRKPARSIVSVDIEQLLMPFRAAKQPVWHCNMACFAGRYGPFGIACPRRFATRCMPAGWPMRPRPMPMASAMLPSGRAGPLQPGLRVAFGSAWRSRRAVGTGCPRWRPVSSWGCLRRLPRWPWCRGHQASRGLGAVVTRPAGRLRGGNFLISARCVFRLLPVERNFYGQNQFLLVFNRQRRVYRVKVVG